MTLGEMGHLRSLSLAPARANALATGGSTVAVAPLPGHWVRPASQGLPSRPPSSTQQRPASRPSVEKPLPTRVILPRLELGMVLRIS